MPSAKPHEAAAPITWVDNFSILRTMVALGAIQVVTMGFTLMRSKIAAVVLGPEGVGAISLIDQVAALVGQVCAFSLPFAAAKFLSFAHSEGQEAFANLYFAFFRILLVLSLFGTGIGIVLVLLHPSLLGRGLAAYRGIAILAFLAIPATNLIMLLTSSISAARRVQASGLYGAIGALLLALLAGAGTYLAALRGYYWGNLLALVATVVVGTLYLYRSENLRIRHPGIRLLQQIRRYPKVTSLAASLYVTSFMMPLAYLIGRYSMLETHGLQAAGLLQAAMAQGLVLFAVMRQSNALFLTPAMNRAGGPQEKFRQAMEFLRVFSVLIGVIALPLVLFPDWWLRLLYSKTFLPATAFIFWFVIAQAVQLLAGVNLALLVGLDHIGAQAKITLCGFASLALLSWLLVPRLGIAGVGIAVLCNGLITFCLSAWRLWVLRGMAVHRAVGWLPLCVVFVIAVCGAVSARLGGNGWEQIILKAGIWIGFTIGALRLTPSKSGNLLKDLFGRLGVS
jgi:PST family polysaccharide transporter